MRIAISGTHCSGKSSLIEAFLDQFPHFCHEVEGYEALEQLHGECFSSEVNAEDLFRQFEYCIERLGAYEPGANVVFERSPFDYVAYLQALAQLRRDTANNELTQQALEIAKGAIDRLDVVAYLPVEGCQIYVSEHEDPQLRRVVDRRLEAIWLRNDLDVFSNSPTIIELSGSTQQRLVSLGAQCFRGDLR